MSNQGGAEAHTQNSGEAGLTASQVVARLVQKNAERTNALERYQGRRSYRLDYVGFPKNLHAEMIVDVIYMAPDSKEFKVVSETGSGWMIKHVFKRLLESEHEALEGGNRERTTLNSENYDFTMLMDKSTEVGCPYVLAVQPKVPNKFVYRGRIWVDAKDFAVCRIEAEPALNPSFWIKQTEIHHAYLKVGDFWFPAENKSVSTLRLGGRATLTIEYRDYKILDARPLRQTDSTSSSAPKSCQLSRGALGRLSRLVLGLAIADRLNKYLKSYACKTNLTKTTNEWKRRVVRGGGEPPGSLP